MLRRAVAKAHVMSKKVGYARDTPPQNKRCPYRARSLSLGIASSSVQVWAHELNSWLGSQGESRRNGLKA